jgi:hypothetical protein
MTLIHSKRAIVGKAQKVTAAQTIVDDDGLVTDC